MVPHLSVASVESLLLEAAAESPVQQKVRELGKKIGDALVSRAGSPRTGGPGGRLLGFPAGSRVLIVQCHLF